MESRDSIKKELVNIGLQNGYSGEMLDLAADLLSYTIYHNQVDIINVAQESSLSTAKLMNSKIKQCMNVMYSVFRGNNSRVILNFIPKTQISVNKFDLVYESNTFKLYANNNYTISPAIEETSEQSATQMECIFSTKTKYEYQVQVDKNNQYYIDVLDDNGHPLSNLSEEVRVFINDIEYPTTRDFYEHINTPIPDNTNDRSKLDKIFILTTPDFGIKLFKRGYYKETSNGEKQIYGYFPIGSTVRVECLHYTRGLASDYRLTDGDINPDEFNKILIPGTVLAPFENEHFDGYETGRKFIDEVDRENENSILYNANSSSRMQSQILSNSDVCSLFSEYFISSIKSAGMRYDNIGDKGILTIFYIPRIEGYSIPQSQIDEFRERYRSYFITTDIEAVSAELGTVEISMEIYLNGTDEVGDEIDSILAAYTDKLTERSNYSEEYIINSQTLSMDYDYYSQLINLRVLSSQINKLNLVQYVNSLRFESIKYYSTSSIISSLGDKLPTSTTVTYIDSKGESRTVRVPMYYKFKPIITYKNSYESIS